MFKLILCFLYLHLSVLYGAKILGVFIVPSISHQMVFQPIWKELSLRGHEVTVLTPNPLNNATLVNLIEIDLGSSYKILRDSHLQTSLNKNLPLTTIVESNFKLMSTIVKSHLTQPEVQALINDKTKHFDVVITEFVYPTMYALSARFKCPLIGVTSFGGLLPSHDAVGNPTHPVLYPDLFLPFVGRMGIYNRMYSIWFSIWYRYYYYYYIIPQEDQIARKYIDEDIPYLGDIEKNVSMLFLSENPFINHVRPNVPTVQQIGRMHIVEKKPLPKDLQIELDTATRGVVYFNLGSNVKSTHLSSEVVTKIVEALSELPYKVLWKWEDDHLPKKPKNVVIRKWFPQQDILGHPNVKVFLTQGGLQSMDEAISNGVPLVGMPFFGDQPVNVMKMVDIGIAQAVDPETFTKDQLKVALIEVAENDKYRQRVREIAELLADVPMTGLEKVIWWTEYVIRHKGTRHIRSPAVDIPWYEYLLLDVLGVVLGITLIVMFVLYKILFLITHIWKKYYVAAKVKSS